jgi:hypothetical protein
MSPLRLTLIVLFGTFAFALFLGGMLSLREKEAGDRENKLGPLSDLDPTFITDAFRLFTYTSEWKEEHRTSLILAWSGITCGFVAFVVAVAG